MHNNLSFTLQLFKRQCLNIRMWFEMSQQLNIKMFHKYSFKRKLWRDRFQSMLIQTQVIPVIHHHGWVVDQPHLFTLDPPHPFTLDPLHQFTLDPLHPFTLTPPCSQVDQDHQTSTPEVRHQFILVVLQYLIQETVELGHLEETGPSTHHNLTRTWLGNVNIQVSYTFI